LLSINYLGREIDSESDNIQNLRMDVSIMVDNVDNVQMNELVICTGSYSVNVWL